jgi:hypothetical protein
MENEVCYELYFIDNIYIDRSHSNYKIKCEYIVISQQKTTITVQ